METPNSSTTGRTPDAYRKAAERTVQNARQQLHDAAERHTEELGSQTRAGMHHLREQAESVKGTARELSSQATTMVKSRPWLAMGAAALVGLALARLLR